MAISPDSMAERLLDFRAPPPSPIASSRRSSFTNDDVLSEFLENSVRVPDLVLPDKVFPKQRLMENPPTIDFLALNSEEIDAPHSQILEAIAKIGCFQLVNHGISEELVKQTMASASGIIFGVPPEKRPAVTRSQEKNYGFEEESEQFVWCENESFKSEMEGICAPGYSNFRERMERLTGEVERIGEELVKAMGMRAKGGETSSATVTAGGGGVWYLKKHKWENWEEGSLRNEAIRMLIRGFEHSHALCLHLCQCQASSSSEFHVYSKRGWVSFSPLSHALLVTVGDQLQAWSGGRYRQAVGKAVYKEESISMVYLYSDVESWEKKKMIMMGKAISLSHQLHFVLFLSLLFRFFLYLFNN